MIIEWDEIKNRINQRKHRVSFETAKLVFDDPYHISIQDRHEQGEERWQTFGIVNGVVMLMVAHTYQQSPGEDVVRIISARKATASERRRYEQNH